MTKINITLFRIFRISYDKISQICLQYLCFLLISLHADQAANDRLIISRTDDKLQIKIRQTMQGLR